MNTRFVEARAELLSEQVITLEDPLADFNQPWLRAHRSIPMRRSPALNLCESPDSEYRKRRRKGAESTQPVVLCHKRSNKGRSVSPQSRVSNQQGRCLHTLDRTRKVMPLSRHPIVAPA